jgi:pyruvate dehydrogenase E2 component (dihydrolipoamide acetyltransferase)
MSAMSRSFRLPDLGEGLAEAEIVNVLVREGDVIPEDAPLLEVETDKAQVEIPSPFGGRVEKIHVRPGQTVTVGEVLVTFADDGVVGAAGPGPRAGSETPPRPEGAHARRPEKLPAAASVGATGASPPSDVGGLFQARGASVGATGASPPRDVGGLFQARGASLPPGVVPVPAAPATRRLARELGVDLRAVPGSGSGGRVTDDDVRAAAAQPRTARVSARRKRRTFCFWKSVLTSCCVGSSWSALPLGP